MLKLLRIAATLLLVTARFTIDERGYFRNDSQLYMPFGVNYWPRSTGSNLWTASTFPAAEIDRDFAILRKDGFNTVRIFPLFPTFEPSPGRFNETAFANLAAMMATARGIGRRRLRSTCWKPYSTHPRGSRDWLLTSPACRGP